MDSLRCSKKWHEKIVWRKDEQMGGTEKIASFTNEDIYSQKSGILTREQLHKVLTECFDASIGVDLLCLIIISLIIAVLLRQTEVFMIEVDEVKLCENTRRLFVEFAHATKTGNRGFGFMLPTGKYQWFRSYIRTLVPKK